MAAPGDDGAVKKVTGGAWQAHCARRLRQRSIHEFRWRAALIIVGLLWAGGTGAWADEPRTKEDAASARMIIEKALANASARSSLLDEEDRVWGHDGEFVQLSQDGSFRLELGGQIQLRYVFNHQRLSADEELDETEGGFTARRTKLMFMGHALDRALTYRVFAAFDRESGAAELQDAVVGFTLDEDVTLRAGRFRPRFAREQVISSRRQLAAERSLVANALGLDRMQGVAARFERGRLRAEGGVMDIGGELGGDETSLVSGRIDAVMSGNGFDAFDDFSSEPGEGLGILLGAGVAYRFEELEFDTEDEEDSLQWTVDLTIEHNGASLFASVIGAHVDPAVGDDFTRWGVVVQGGQRITDNLELFARYEWGDAGDDSDKLNILTVGGNWFMHGHAAKLTVDAGYGFNPVSDFWSSSGANWRTDANGEDGQLVMRMQWQLLF